MEKMEINRQGCPALRVVMFPKDTNPMGNIFGGVILSHVDVAAGIAARSATKHRVVTRSFKEAEFKKPVKVGDILTCWAWVTKVGTTSISTHVVAEVERHGEYIKVTEAEVVYVAVDEHDRPIPVDSPPGTQGKDKPVTPAPVVATGDATTVTGAAGDRTSKDAGDSNSCGGANSGSGAQGCSCNQADEADGKGKKSKKRSGKEKKRTKKEAKRAKKEAKRAKKEAKRSGKEAKRSGKDRKADEPQGVEKGSGCRVCSPPSGGNR